MPTLTENDIRELSQSEYADLGKRLAKSYSELMQMREDAKDAMKELKDGIERQEKHVYGLAEAIRSGQRELAFGEGVQKLVDSVPDGTMATVQVEGHDPVVIADKRPKGKDRKSKAAGE